MKAPATDFTKTGDLGGRRVEMSFDENSLAFLQSTMIDLYSDPTLAVIREYSTNAYDSHVEAGQTRPIEVSTPTALSPYFKVKDYGVGMSIDDIERVYSKYGASTKRETDEQVGMLGLGSKSALTFTNQFNVRAVKNGKQIFVSVSRALNGGGEMTILTEQATTEPNGVEIIIPAPSNPQFQSKCERFFQFWKPGTVLVNGKEPKRPELLKVTDRIYLGESINRTYSYDRQSFIVMGNVAYEVNWSKVSGGTGKYAMQDLIAFVDIGEVNFPPNREQLQYTNRTLETLRQLRDEYQNGVVPAIENSIANAKTHAEALDLAYAWKNKFGYGLSVKDLKYKGVQLPEAFTFDFQYRPGGLYAEDPNHNWLFISKPGVTIITGCDVEKLSSYRKAQIKQWAIANGISEFNHFLVSAEMPGSPWTDSIKTYDWQDIKATKIARTNSGGKKKTPSWDAIIDGKGQDVTSFDTAKPLVYASKTELKDKGFHHSSSYALADLLPKTQIALLNKNQIDKFKVAYPTAINYIDALKIEVATREAALTKEQKYLLEFNYNLVNRCMGLDHARVEDPELAEIVRVASEKQQHKQFLIDYERWQDIGYRIGVISYDKRYGRNTLTAVSDYLKRYPLLSSTHDSLQKEHMYMYINHCYNTLYKEKDSEEKND